MADSTTAENTSGKSDIWIALGVVACLALGASVTFLMTGGRDSGGHQQKTVVSKGELIVAHGESAKAAPGSTSTNTSTNTAPNGESDYLPVTFDTLAGFYYEPPPVEDEGTEKPTILKRPKDQIPAPVRALDGKKVAVQGFMVPFKLEKGATRTFLLVKDQSYCCFGRTPRMNEWISVSMNGNKTTKLITDQVVTAFGTLHVSEESVQGVVLSIYRFDCDDVAGPLDL